MVNTLSGSVCAYRKETVKPRFIRIDEVMALLDVTQDEAMDIALAAGARYQLAKIILVHKERLMKFMKHSARVPSSNKIVEKKFVRIGEGSMTYSIGHHRFIEMARAAGAVYKIGEAIMVIPISLMPMQESKNQRKRRHRNRSVHRKCRSFP